MHFHRPTRVLPALLAAALTASPAAAQHVWKPAQPPPPVRGTAAPAPPPPSAPSPDPAPYRRHHGERDEVVGPDLPNCQVVLSGAVSGVYGCSFVQASTEGNGWSRVRITSNASERVLNVPEVQVDVGFPGAPAAGVVHGDADAAQGSTVWLRQNGAVWGLRTGRGGSSGTYALRFSRASDGGAMGFGRAYAVAGTLEADLAAWDGSSAGSVHLEIRF